MHIPVKPARDYKIICNTNSGRETFVVASLLDEEEEYNDYVSLIYSCRNTEHNIRIVFYEDYEEVYRITPKRETLLTTDFQIYNARGERVF